MNRPIPRPSPLRLVPPEHVPSVRAQATWALRKIRNLATVLRSDDRMGGLLLRLIRERIEGELWAAMVLRKGLEALTHKGAE